MSSLPDNIKYIEFTEVRRKALLKEMTTLNQQISEKQKEVRQALLAGETTGDHIRDMVLAVYGFCPELEDQFCKFEGQLVGKKGEFTLLSYEAKKPFKYSATRVECRHTSCYRLGVLEGEGFVWKKDESSLFKLPITFPVSRYIKGEVGFIRPGDNLGGVVQENIFASMYNDEDPPSFQALMQSERGRILIGDEEVKGWLQKHGMEELFKTAAATLSKLILEQTDDTV